MVRQYNKQSFIFSGANNITVHFNAHTTDTRHGFCHTVRVFTIDNNFNLVDYTNTKTSYLNRTWERYDYETTLLKAAEKLPKSQRDVIKNAIRNYN